MSEPPPVMSMMLQAESNNDWNAPSSNDRIRPMTTTDDPEARPSNRVPKRRCSGGGIKQPGHEQAPIVSRDCFEEVTSPRGPSALRQDWFYQIPTLQTQSLLQPQQEEPQHLERLQSELQSLDKQLLQVKRRFLPAAERCAAASHNSPSKEFELARRACNPYEILGETKSGGLNHGLFLNRSAIKLANIDSLLNFGLVASAATTTTSTNEFTFCDLCAAPGGFSEYILRRFCHSITQHQHQQQHQQQHAQEPLSCRGFGMSLEGNNDQGHGTDWKLTQGPLYIANIQGGPSVYYHICTGADGTGDIFQWPNVQALQHLIGTYQQQQQQQQLVHLVLADGGVDAQRNVEHPEGETQKLVVCQVAAALALLQPGGRFLLKLLSCQTTPILQSVLYELSTCFDTLQVLKPISSRPASAERYLVCTGFRPHDTVLRQGPHWISRVLLGRPIPPPLQLWLAQIDRDLMHLNLKACFAILSHLDTKTMQLANPHLAVLPHNATASCMEHDDDDDAWIAQGYHGYQEQEQHETIKTAHYNHTHQWYSQHQQSSVVDTEQYRMAWRLF
jgi:23S rRNA U2552 (ribose-2'-O)-methylase RlmE/FtsJ